MYDRFIKNWLSTALGTSIIIFDMYLLAAGKVDVPSFTVIFGLGAVVAGFKYKK